MTHSDAATGLPLAQLLGETRARVVDLLRGRPQTIAELAESLELSEEAVRRHLRALERDDLVVSALQHDGNRGRPSAVYRITDRGHRLYPDRTADLANELWEYLEVEHGRRAVLGFLRWRQQRQARRYATELEGSADDLQARTEALAGLLSDDGFLAESGIVTAPDGTQVLQLTQSHCAVRDVAAEHPEICAYEAAMFKDLLGARISRRQTIAAGATRCVCTIEETPASAPPHRSSPAAG